MARRFGTFTVPAQTTSTGTKTQLQIRASANAAVAITRLFVGGHGISNTNEPIRVDLVRQSDAGTGMGSTPVGNKLDTGITHTFQTTAAATEATVEPTTTDVIKSFTFHPQTGLDVAFGREDEVIIPVSGRVGVRTLQAGTAPKLDITVDFEE